MCRSRASRLSAADPIFLGQYRKLPDGTFEPLQPVDEAIIRLLRERDGRLTEVLLRDERRLRVLNVALGYDAGEAFAKVTANISPSGQGEGVDMFCTEDIVDLWDHETGERLTPGVS